MNEIKELIKKEKEKIIEKEFEEIESKHTNISKRFEAMRLLKKKKTKNRLIIYNGNDNVVNTEKQQTNEIINFFR